MISALYNGVEAIFAWINRCSRKSIYSYCGLESADDEYTLITKDGALVSVFEYSGVNHIIASEEYQYLCQQVTAILSPLLQKKGVQLKIFFRYDDAGTENEVENLLAPSIKTAERLKLEISDYFNAKVKKLSAACVFEKCYIVLWTTPQALNDHDLKKAYKEKAERFKNKSLKISPHSQHILHVINEVRLQHSATMTNLQHSMSSLGIALMKLEVNKVLNILKQQLSPDTTNDRWQAHLPGDRIYPKSGQDWSGWLWPSLSRQLLSENGKNVDMSSCVVGSYRYAPVVISLFPKHIHAFYELFTTLKGYDLPWQISFSLVSGGIKISQSKALLAQFLTFSSHENRLICDANKLLKHLNENSDTPVINFSVAIITWAPVNDESLFQRRRTSLIKAVQSWGGVQTTQSLGDPFRVLSSSLLAFNRARFPCAVAAPLNDPVAMLPFFRPATSWDYGATLFKTPDGKLWPYQSGSSQQVSWIELIYARSGSGKSVLLNALNLAACLGKGIDALPYISILDVGKSSHGIIEFIEKTSEYKGVAKNYSFEFSADDAINPFDTHLGARMPSHAHRDFLINLLSVLLVEDIENSLPEGMDAMVSMVIDELYRLCSDDCQPKLYHQGLNPEIDGFVSESFDSISQLTWWQITDRLFEKGKKSLAETAQRYAMPLLSDLIVAVNQHAILDLYQSIQLENSETFIQYFCRNITALIKTFPSINMVTKLSVSAKIVSFDLASVMSGGSAKDARTSVIAYMLVRHLTSSYFFVKSHDLGHLAPMYATYHQKKIKELLMIPKRIVFDEFHRTHGCKPILRQVITDMREGRKQNIQIALASQSLSDFSLTMLEFATSIFILSGGNQSALKQTVEHFGLNDTEALALKNCVHGPSVSGMNFIAQFHTTKGINTQLLNLTLCAYELWIFTTTAEDVYLKTGLSEYLDILHALKMLSSRFPDGTAKPYFETQLKLYPSKTFKQIAHELVENMAGEYYEKVVRS